MRKIIFFVSVCIVVVLLSACKRNTFPYGWVEEEQGPEYTEEVRERPNPNTQ